MCQGDNMTTKQPDDATDYDDRLNNIKITYDDTSFIPSCNDTPTQCISEVSNRHNIPFDILLLHIIA